MSKPKKRIERSPPQGSVVWYKKFLELLEKRKITKVDKEFLRNQGIASGNETKFISGLKFLGLIDEEGNATEAMDSLGVLGEKRKENLKKIIQNAYSLLFDKVKIDLEKADAETLVNSFKTDYKMGSLETAKQAAKIFVFLAQQAGLPMSEAIIKKLAVTERKIIRKKPIKKEKEHTYKKEKMAELLPEGAVAYLTVKNIGYVVIKDKDTYELAKEYLRIVSKKLGITEGK